MGTSWSSGGDKQVSNRERCAVLVVVLAAVIGCSACRETFEQRYATRREAEQAGAIKSADGFRRGRRRPPGRSP